VLSSQGHKVLGFIRIIYVNRDSIKRTKIIKQISRMNNLDWNLDMLDEVV
jgi:hypothetical protein